MRVLVNADDDGSGDGPSRINIRVPLQLLRAGVRLTSLVPPQALTRANAEELVDQLDEVMIDIDDPGSKVQVFCE